MIICAGIDLSVVTMKKYNSGDIVADRDQDLDYYQTRAEEEVERARRAQSPAVVAVHYELAELYLARINPKEQS